MAAKQLDLALRSTPWALTHNFILSDKESKGMQAEFAGQGDPTGKGRGFSFVKDTKRVGCSPYEYSTQGKVLLHALCQHWFDRG